MGVYGNFLDSFSELLEKVQVWTAEDKSDLRVITGVSIPTNGSKLDRYRYSEGTLLSARYNGSAAVLESEMHLYVPARYDGSVNVGDYVTSPATGEQMRVLQKVRYIKQAGYFILYLQSVVGATAEDTTPLPIKEAVYD